jgi:hypothetical protein
MATQRKTTRPDMSDTPRYLYFSSHRVLCGVLSITAWMMVEPPDSRAMVSSGPRCTPCQPPRVLRRLSISSCPSLALGSSPKKHRTRTSLVWLYSFLPKPMATASFAASRSSSAASSSWLSKSRSGTWPKTRISRRCSWSLIARLGLD